MLAARVLRGYITDDEIYAGRAGSKPCGTAVIFGGEKPPRAENKFGEANAKKIAMKMQNCFINWIKENRF